MLCFLGWWVAHWVAPLIAAGYCIVLLQTVQLILKKAKGIGTDLV